MSWFPVGVSVHIINILRMQPKAAQWGCCCIAFYAFKSVWADQMFHIFHKKKDMRKHADKADVTAPCFFKRLAEVWG